MKKDLALLLVIFVVVQAFFLSFHPLDGEECIRGAIADKFLNQVEYNPYHIQPDPYTGGSLLSGILIAPLFHLFGQTYYVLKIYPILISILVFVISYFFFDFYFNKKAAQIMSVLLIGAPLLLRNVFLTAWGGYNESILFSILIIHFYFKEDYFKFGLISGFAFYNQYSALVTIGLCGLFWLFKKLKGFKNAILGFFIGLLPWLIFNIQHSWIGLFLPGNLPLSERIQFSLEFFYANIKDGFFLPEHLSWVVFFVYIVGIVLTISNFKLVQRMKLFFGNAAKKTSRGIKTGMVDKKTTDGTLQNQIGLLLILYIPLFWVAGILSGQSFVTEPDWKGYIHIVFIYWFILGTITIALHKFKQGMYVAVIFALIILIFSPQLGQEIAVDSAVCHSGVAIVGGMNYVYLGVYKTSVLQHCMSYGNYSEVCEYGYGIAYQQKNKMCDCSVFEDQSNCLNGCIKSDYVEKRMENPLNIK